MPFALSLFDTWSDTWWLSHDLSRLCATPGYPCAHTSVSFIVMIPYGYRLGASWVQEEQKKNRKLECGAWLCLLLCGHGGYTKSETHKRGAEVLTCTRSACFAPTLPSVANCPYISHCLGCLGVSERGNERVRRRQRLLGVSRDVYWVNRRWVCQETSIGCVKSLVKSWYTTL